MFYPAPYPPSQPQPSDDPQQSRDLIGYGSQPPCPQWPNNAVLALSFVINYEEGAESSVCDGDPASEYLLTDITGAIPYTNTRNLNIESMYEYGSRSGVWRLLRLFKGFDMPVTVFACGMALEKNPHVAQAMNEARWEISSHGYRWLDYTGFEATGHQRDEASDIKLAVLSQEGTAGYRPLGLYQGKPSTRTLTYMMQAGGFVYSNDAYSDDLPYWHTTVCHGSDDSGVNSTSSTIMPKGGPPSPEIVNGFHEDNNAATKRMANGSSNGIVPPSTTNSPALPMRLLVVPYTLDANDMKFVVTQGYSAGGDFYEYLKDSFDCLRREGLEGSPKMLSIGLHCRLSGRPGRIEALRRFLQYVATFPDVWICRRLEIALHWYREHSSGVGIPPHIKALLEGTSPLPWKARVAMNGFSA